MQRHGTSVGEDKANIGHGCLALPTFSNHTDILENWPRITIWRRDDPAQLSTVEPQPSARFARVDHVAPARIKVLVHLVPAQRAVQDSARVKVARSRIGLSKSRATVSLSWCSITVSRCGSKVRSSMK